MITLASDCLVFEMAGGQSIPFSAEIISVELTGDEAGVFDPEFIKHATNAVFHYFKHGLGRHTITVGEFAGALEKVLRGFNFDAALPDLPPPQPRVIESDLRRLADESGNGCELFFFHRLRDELRLQLEQEPQLVRFRGLRGCVKQLAGARRWCARCQTLHEQIVDYLRNCLTLESARKNCALLVD
jgi:hypothetical protein